MTEAIECVLPAQCAGQRLDRALVQALADKGYSRSRLQQLLTAGAVVLDGAVVTAAAQTVKGGERLCLTPPPVQAA